MDKTQKYVRLIWELEVEVTDFQTVKAFNFDVTANGGMLDVPFNEAVARAATMAAVNGGIMGRETETGIRWLGGGAMVRPQHEDGYYTEVTYPEMPGRDDGGSDIMPPSWEDLDTKPEDT